MTMSSRAMIFSLMRFSFFFGVKGRFMYYALADFTNFANVDLRRAAVFA